jgi:hypothetical protein
MQTALREYLSARGYLAEGVSKTALALSSGDKPRGLPLVKKATVIRGKSVAQTVLEDRR